MSTSSKKKIPLLGDGSIVSDYDPLFKYWELAREMRREELIDKAMLKNNDFKYIEELIQRERFNLLELLNILEDYFLHRVDGEVAKEAYSRVYGVDIDPLEARRRLARILGGWLIEASIQSRKIKVSGPRLPAD